MLVLLSLTGNAQKTVFQNLSWEQAAELAQKENKIILVDAMREPATPEARKQKDKEEAVWQKVAANLEFCKQHVVATVWSRCVCAPITSMPAILPWV